MFKRFITLLTFGCSLATFAVAAEPSQDIAEAGRQVLAKNKESLVFISTVAKMTIGSDTHDEKMEATGLMIDPSGLAICSLSTIDPGAVLGSSQPDPNVKTSLSDVKIMRADNTEIPAKLVLKDPDLDLAFIQADKTTSATFAAVTLEKNFGRQDARPDHHHRPLGQGFWARTTRVPQPHRCCCHQAAHLFLHVRSGRFHQQPRLFAQRKTAWVPPVARGCLGRRRTRSGHRAGFRHFAGGPTVEKIRNGDTAIETHSVVPFL